MSDASVSQDSRNGERQRGISDAVVEYCVPDEANVKGPERAGRTVIGVGIGGFSITGVVAASRPVLGLGLTLLLLIVAAYLLVTAKTKKCPVKHVTSKQLSAVEQ